MKFRFSICLILVALIYGCSTDFDVTAPYKEIIVVDGFLNVVDTVQSVRISKAFLGEGNAYTMAQVSDSINYANVLDVKMDRILNGLVMNTYSMTRSEQNDKDSGIFAFPFYVLYKLNQPILSDGSEYRLRVTNTQTGNSVSSKTKIVHDVVLNYPFPPPYNPPFSDSIDLASAWTSPFNVIFEPGTNSRIYDFILRFHYREIDPFGNSIEHSIDWNFTDFSNTILQNELEFKFYKKDLYSFIGASIPDKAGYVRRTDSLSGGKRAFEFILIEGTEDLEIYYQLQQPTTGIVQELPTFTTVQNGLGLFTSRVVHPYSYYPTDLTEDSLQNSQYTRSKNFQF